MQRTKGHRFDIRSDDKYLQDVKSLVPWDQIWVAIKTDAQLQYITLNGVAGYQLTTGEVLTLRELTWNEMLGFALFDQAGLHPLSEPEFLTPADVKMGVFEDVFKMGYILRPLGAYKDFENNPIVIRKARRK